MGKFFMMYGFDLNRMRDVVTRTKKKFDQIYDFQSKGETFASPIDLLKRLGPEQTHSNSFNSFL